MRHMRAASILWFATALLAPTASMAQPAPAATPAYTGPTAGVVRLPWADFRDLVDRLRALQEPDEAPPPADSVISTSVYRVVVDPEEKQARVEAELELMILRREGWVDVPLLPDSAALEAFAVDGRSATLTQRDGFHRLVAQAGYVYYGAPTARKVTMTYRLNVRRDDGPHGLELPVAEAAVTRVELTLPRVDQDLRIEPGGVVLERAAEAEGTGFAALVPRTRAVALRWWDRAAEVREEPLRAVADVVHRIAFQRHVVSGELSLTVRVERGSFDAVVLRFPSQVEGIRATDDFSVDVAPEGEEAGAAQQATVRAGYARREDTTIVLRYEMARNVGRIEPPDVRVVRLLQAGQDREVVRQSGFLELYAAEGMEVRAEGPPQGAEPCDVSEVPGTTELEGLPVMAYRTSGLPLGVPVEVTRHEERAVLASAVQRARLDLVVNREGKAVGNLVLSVQNNERQFVGVWLPRGAQLWATFVRGLPVKPSGENEWVMIPVPRSAIGPDGVPETIPVEVIYYQDVPRIAGAWGGGSFDAPRVDLLVSNYDVTVWVPDEFRYFAFEGEAKAQQESVGPVALVAPGRPARDAVRTAHAYIPEEPLVALAEPQAAEIAIDGEYDDRVAAKSSRDREATAEKPAEATEQEDQAARTWADQDGTGGVGARGIDTLTLRGDVGRQVVSGRHDVEFHRVVSVESRGLLPIRIDVPRQGLALRFERSLVEPKDETTISFRYQGRGVLALFPWARALGGLLLALGLALGLHRCLVRRRLAPGAVAPVALAAGVALTVVLGVAFHAPLGGVGWALFGGLLAYGAVVGLVLLYRFWRAQRGGGPGGGPAVREVAS